MASSNSINTKNTKHVNPLRIRTVCTLKAVLKSYRHTQLSDVSSTLLFIITTQRPRCSKHVWCSLVWWRAVCLKRHSLVCGDNSYFETGRFLCLLSWFFHIDTKISHWINRFAWFLPTPDVSRCCYRLQCLYPSVPHLWNEEVAWGQLSARLLHLAVTLHLEVFQVAAALHHGLHLWLYLTDVEASHCELLLDHTGDLHGLQTNEVERGQTSRGDVRLRLSGGDLKTAGGG